MKKISLIILISLSVFYLNAQTKSQPRLHNWIATFIPEPDVAKALRHVMVMSDGTLRSWRPGGEPAPFLDINDAVQVSAGNRHLLILRKNGTIWALGKNDYYQLGNEQLSNSKTKSAETPVKVTGIADAISISASGNTSYALLKDGTVWAWGDGNNGAIGDGADKITSELYGAGASGKISPTKVKNIIDAVEISGSMALLKDGTVWTWGSGTRGRLGNNTTKATSTPVKVEGLNNVISIASRYEGCYALLANGTIKSWGDNLKGQLGNSSKGDILGESDDIKRLVPVSVVGINNAVDVDGAATCFALLNDGTVKGWGWGMLGALSPVQKEINSTPKKVHDLKNVIAIKAGTAYGFALQKDGTLLGWGASMIVEPPYNHSMKVVKIASFGSLAPKPTFR